MREPRIFVRDIKGGWALATGNSISIGVALPYDGAPSYMSAVYVNENEAVFVGRTEACEEVAEKLAAAIIVRNVDERMAPDPNRMLRVKRDGNGVLNVVVVGCA